MKHLLVIYLTSIILEINAKVDLPPFDSFVHLYNRKYIVDSAEYKQREETYLRRMQKAVLHNRRAEKLWTAGVNKHWDWTDAELQELFGKQATAPRQHGFLATSSSQRQVHAHRRPHTEDSVKHTNATSQRLPQQKSWGHLQSVSGSLSDQGDCGSCWAIAAASLLQAHHEIHMAKPRTFSAQEMLSCVTNPMQCGGKGGCKGATMMLALDWAWKNGVASSEQEPYVSGDNGQSGQCSRLSQSLNSPSGENGGLAFGMQSWKKLPENKYEPLLRALFEFGPVGVSVASSEWFDYSSGIFDDCSRFATINHAVILYGFGEEKGIKYWSIQNSWGTDWGENGHMRLLRRGNEESWCGTDFSPEAGTGCKDGPSTVEVCGMCGILYSPVVPIFKSI